MSNIREEVTDRRRALFDLVKSVGTLSTGQAVEASGYTLGQAATYLAEMCTANLLKRERVGSAYIYSTDVAEFRWGERERRLVADQSLQATLKAREQKAEQKVERKAAPALRPVAPSPAPALELHPNLDVVKQLVNKIQDLPYRDVMRLKAALQEMFA